MEQPENGLLEKLPEYAKRFLKDRLKLRNGHEAIMLQDAQQNLRQSRKAVDAHNQMFLGTPPDESDDVIHLGDNNNVHHHIPRAGVSPLAQALTALALVIGGGIAGHVLFGGSNPTNVPQEIEFPAWKIQFKEDSKDASDE